MLNQLKEKNILLILPCFFGYDNIIVTKLKSVGASVTVIYENIDEISYYYRFINAYLPNKMPHVMNQYLLKKTESIAEKLDYVLLIRGEFVTSDFLKFLKSKTPYKCKYLMYQWDSVENNKNSLKIKKFFDYISTFDPVDAKVYGWTYRPLFFIPDFIEKKNENIDVLFMCSLHSERIALLNKLKERSKEKSLNLFSHVYSKKIIFYKRKYLTKRKEYISADNKDVSFKKISIADAYNYYNSSKIIVDYTHPKQNGLTMRTIEALGCGKKLITNNRNILNADFYNPRNILIYDDAKITLPDDFLNSAYCPPPKNIYEKYSIDEWLSSIMNLK